MKRKAPTESAPVSENVLEQLTVELHRLAGSIKRDIKNKSTLKSLSNLTAITPIQQMLVKHLSGTLLKSGEPEQNTEYQKVPGYL